MNQQEITRQLESRFDVLVEWQYEDTMYVEYIESGMGEPVMPDWMYDDLSMYDYGYEVCDHRPERYGYGIYVIFCDAIRP